MTGTEGEKWKELPNHQSDVDTTRRDNPYVGMPQGKNSKQAASWKLRAGSWKKFDKK